MQDVRLALDGAFETAGSSVAAQAGPVTPPWRRALPVAAAVVLTAAIVGGAAWSLRPAPAPPAPVAGLHREPEAQYRRCRNVAGRGTRMDHCCARCARRQDAIIRSIGDVEAHLVSGRLRDRGPVNVAFLPDGESVAFYSLRTVRSSASRWQAGGTDDRSGHAAAEWPHMGRGRHRGRPGVPHGVFRVSPNGGKPEPLATVEAGEEAYGPQVLPGGKFMMFTVARNMDTAASTDGHGAHRRAVARLWRTPHHHQWRRRRQGISQPVTSSTRWQGRSRGGLRCRRGPSVVTRWRWSRG